MCRGADSRLRGRAARRDVPSLVVHLCAGMGLQPESLRCEVWDADFEEWASLDEAQQLADGVPAVLPHLADSAPPCRRVPAATGSEEMSAPARLFAGKARLRLLPVPHEEVAQASASPVLSATPAAAVLRSTPASADALRSTTATTPSLSPSQSSSAKTNALLCAYEARPAQNPRPALCDVHSY